MFLKLREGFQKIETLTCAKDCREVKSEPNMITELGKSKVSSDLTKGISVY